MNDPLREKWDTRYRSREGDAEPARVLLENVHLLPARGDALDLACGLGANARLLARQGLRVSAWDLSQVAVDRLAGALGPEEQKFVRPEVRDVQAHPPAPDSFDVIVVSYFLDRELTGSIVKALRPGGMVFYQTFVRDAVSEVGPSNPAYRLERNELLRLFPGLWLRFYREDGTEGDVAQGVRDIAMLVAQRPF
jgi:SAM-dependent methyltransferase